MTYSKQYNRVLSNYVIRNRKFIQVESSAQSLWDASFAIRVGKLIKLAQEFGLLENILDTSRFKLEASYSVMAITTDEFIDALKYFAVLSYALEKAELPNIPMNSIQAWQQAAINVFSPFKINLTRPFTKISTILSRPNVKLMDAKGEPTPAFETLYDQTKEIRDLIYPKKGKILADPAATANLRTFLGNIFTYFNRKEETGFKNVMLNVRFLNDPKLSTLLHVAPEEINNSAINDYLNWIKKKTTRKDPRGLTTEEVKSLSDKDKEIHKKLIKDYKTTYSDKMRDLIRSTGKQTAPAQNVKNALKESGFPQHQNIPINFTGNVDEKGGLYTHTGVPLSTGQTGGDMIMNPDWDPRTDNEYYAKGKSAESKTGKYGHFYTVNYNKTHTQAKKTEKVAELAEKMEDMQDAWRKDLISKNSPNKMLAAMVEAMYQTQSRIGTGSGETAGETTYGLSTWLNKHVKTNAAGNIIITYPGKKGMINKHVIRGETPEQVALIKYMGELKEGKRPNDPIWTDANGKRLTDSMVNKYLKELGFSGTAHKFRTHKGTEMFKQLIEEKPLRKANPTPKEVDLYHKAITERIGAILGHQRTKADGTTVNVGTTAAKSYIDPSVQIKLFRDKHVPVPKWLEGKGTDEGTSPSVSDEDEDYEAPTVTQRVKPEPQKTQRKPRTVVHEDEDEDMDFETPTEPQRKPAVKVNRAEPPKNKPEPVQQGRRVSRNVEPEDDEDEIPVKVNRPEPRTSRPQPAPQKGPVEIQKGRRVSRNIVEEDED